MWLGIIGGKKTINAIQIYFKIVKVKPIYCSAM